MILRYALIGEGSSDRSLLPIVNWVINEAYPDVLIEAAFFTPRTLGGGALSTAMIEYAGRLHQADLIFVHKDADNVGLVGRIRELALLIKNSRVAAIPVVPVREMEAWLLVDQDAIRVAANNRNGRADLLLPTAQQIERIRDPKLLLRQAIWVATELPSSRKSRFDEARAVSRVSEVCCRFEALRRLSSFVRFEDSARTVMAQVMAVISVRS